MPSESQYCPSCPHNNALSHFHTQSSKTRHTHWLNGYDKYIYIYIYTLRVYRHFMDEMPGAKTASAMSLFRLIKTSSRVGQRFVCTHDEHAKKNREIHILSVNDITTITPLLLRLCKQIWLTQRIYSLVAFWGESVDEWIWKNCARLQRNNRIVSCFLHRNFSSIKPLHDVII